MERVGYIKDFLETAGDAGAASRLSDKYVDGDVYQRWFFGTESERRDAIHELAGGTKGKDPDEGLPSKAEIIRLFRDSADCTSPTRKESRKLLADLHGGKRLPMSRAYIRFLRTEISRGNKGPVILRTMRLYCDKFIGSHESLQAAKHAAKMATRHSAGDKLTHFNFIHPADRISADTAYANLKFIREELLDNPDYGPSLYEPRRVERGNLSWRQAPLLAGDCLVFFCSSLARGVPELCKKLVNGLPDSSSDDLLA